MSNDSLGADAGFQRAQRLATSGRNTEAIEVYSSIIDCDPRHCNAICGRAIALQRLGDHMNAVSDFSSVIDCFSEWAGAFVAYYGRAVSSLALGREFEVVDDCNRAIQKIPSFVDAIYLRGTAYKALGKLEDAIEDMTAVIQLVPTYYEAFHVRGRLHYLRRCWKKAVDDLTWAIDLSAMASSDTRSDIYFRGMSFQELGNHDAAIADFSSAIELQPDDPCAYLRRSASYRVRGECKLAASDFETANRLLHSGR